MLTARELLREPREDFSMGQVDAEDATAFELEGCKTNSKSF